MQFDPSKQSWDAFVKESSRRAAEQMAESGRREAREVFAQSPAEAATLLRQWEALLPNMEEGMDRAKIAAAVDEFRRLRAQAG
jgi:hypothetical protein